LCLLPNLWRGFVYTLQLREWNFENAEGVNLADAQMNGQGGWRNQPAAVPGMRDGFLAVKKR
jgi:hypothetical protein